MCTMRSTVTEKQIAWHTVESVLECVYTVGSENHSGLLKLTADCPLGVENVRITADLEKSYFCTSCF